MAEVLPFAGTRFNTQNKDYTLGDLVCPPYDTIRSDDQRALHERHAYNIIRLVLGYETPSDDESNNRYSRAQECYREWKATGVLSDEQRKCLYVYEQTFTPEGSKTPVRRIGFFGLVKLMDFRSGKTRALEMTFDSPKQDRLRLIRTIQVNESPLHILYRDQESSVEAVLDEATKKVAPTEEFTTPDGMSHRLWMLHKKEPILKIHEAMKPMRLFIADGHHRYETALKYRDEMREMTGRRDGRQPYDFVLMYLQRAEDESLLTSPFHRVLARELGLDTKMDEVIEDLEEYFNIAEFKLNMKDLDKAAAMVNDKVRANRQAKTRYVMALPNGRAWQLSLKKEADLDEMIEEETMSAELKAMDSIILHNFVITRGWIGNPDVELDEDDIFYRTDAREALDLLQRRKGCVAFFMNPIEKEEVLSIAENGELLPHYSVNFHPKIPSGLVMRDHNVGFG